MSTLNFYRVFHLFPGFLPWLCKFRDENGLESIQMHIWHQIMLERFHPEPILITDSAQEREYLQCLWGENACTESWRAEKHSWTSPITHFQRNSTSALKKKTQTTQRYQRSSGLFSRVSLLWLLWNPRACFPCCVSLLILQSLKLRQSLQEASWMMPPRKMHMLPWSSSLGISPSLIAEMDTAFNPSMRPCRGEQWMSSICIYEEMKIEKSWAFGFCPLLSFTLNVCPGFAVPLHIVLAWTDRALFSVLTYRGIITGPGVLCIT